MKYLFIFLLVISCTSPIAQKKTFKNSFGPGKYLVSGCQIFNMNGEVKNSYPGGQCLFFPDGKLMSYDYGKIELTLYSPDLSVIWRKKIHVHHESLKLTDEGYLYFLSSSLHPYRGQKNVRFDELVLMNVKDGEVIKTFSTFHNLKKLAKHPLIPYEIDWDKNLGFNHEITHMPAIYQLKKPLFKNSKVLIPEKSFLVTSNNHNLPEVIAIDPTFSHPIGKWRLTNWMFYHDAQPFSSHEIIYLINTKFIKPIAKEETARIAIYDFDKDMVTKEYHGDFFAIFSGGLQILNQDLLLVSDSGSLHGLKSENLEGDGQLEFRSREHQKKKARAILFSLTNGVLDELHFDFANQHFRILDLSDFLKNNIGI